MSIESYQFLQALESLAFVEAIYLFGSRARGDHDPRSDIDLAILCPGATDAQWQQVLDIIDAADTLLKIDCVRFDKIQEQAFIDNIKQHHKILYQKGKPS